MKFTPAHTLWISYGKQRKKRRLRPKKRGIRRTGKGTEKPTNQVKVMMITITRHRNQTLKVAKNVDSGTSSEIAELVELTVMRLL
jgi:hypothetical protein